MIDEARKPGVGNVGGMTDVRTYEYVAYALRPIEAGLGRIIHTQYARDRGIFRSSGGTVRPSTAIICLQLGRKFVHTFLVVRARYRQYSFDRR